LNRLHLVSKHSELSLPLCCLVLSIRAAMSLFLGFSRLEGGYFRRFMGNAAGALLALSHSIRAWHSAVFRSCATAVDLHSPTGSAPDGQKQ